MMKIRFARLLPGATLMRRLLVVLGFVAATSIAFVWGRQGGQSHVTAQPPASLLPVAGIVPVAAPVGPSDYNQRVVAYIYNNIPVTREELGEFLIARFGAERVEMLITHKIVDMVAKGKGVTVTDAEVQVEYQDYLKSISVGIGQQVTEKDFQNQILKKFNKTVFEWQEDVIKPMAQLKKICRPMVEVSEQDEIDAFESRFGPRVKGRMIVFEKNTPHLSETWMEVSKSEEKFRDKAMHQSLPNLASTGGEVIIAKHFADPNIEREAFRLKEGEVSPILQLPDGMKLILKCDQLLPRDDTKHFTDLRVSLHQELFQMKLSQKVSSYLKQLRDEANPRILLTSAPARQDQLEREVLKELQTGTPSGSKAPAGS